MSYNRKYSKSNVSQRNNIKVIGSSYWKFRCKVAEERIMLALQLANDSMNALQENNLERAKYVLFTLIRQLETYVRTYMYRKSNKSNNNGGEINE